MKPLTILESIYIDRQKANKPHSERLKKERQMLRKQRRLHLKKELKGMIQDRYGTREQ